MPVCGLEIFGIKTGKGCTKYKPAKRVIKGQVIKHCIWDDSVPMLIDEVMTSRRKGIQLNLIA